MSFWLYWINPSSVCFQKHGCGAKQSALGSDKIVAEKNEEPKRIEENSDDTLEQKSDPSKRLVFAEEMVRFHFVSCYVWTGNY